MADASVKGQTASGERNGTKTHPEALQRGDAHWTRRMPERNGNRKLSDRQVATIRAFGRRKIFTPRELAEIYGVGSCHVSRIIRNAARRETV